MNPSWDEADDRAAGRRSLSGLAAYEDSAVRRVLALLGLSPLAHAVSAASLERTGVDACNFALLHEALPGLPVRFACSRRLRGLRFMSLPDLFDRFTRTPIFVAFDEALADDLDAPACLVFPYVGNADVPAPRGGRFMACHSYEGVHGESTTRITRRVPVGGRPHTITIETLAALVDSFGGWAPD